MHRSQVYVTDSNFNSVPGEQCMTFTALNAWAIIVYLAAHTLIFTSYLLLKISWCNQERDDFLHDIAKHHQVYMPGGLKAIYLATDSAFIFK